ncbi:hypothetical protein [Vibrio owensii]|uniref:hypothetical protein n=1 Tax=Vibrio harveyi group TaxID=717610 RepID=UPI003CC60C11
MSSLVFNEGRYDHGNGRLYVKDSKKRSFVILDNGKGMEGWGLPRFEVCTHSKDGEPDSPIRKDISWMYNGETHGDFVKGLRYDAPAPEPGLEP